LQARERREIAERKPINIKENTMAEATRGSMVYVYDKGGNAYLCDRSDLRDASTVSDEEKATCTDLDHAAFTRNE
jgi:hypothetical protein